MKITAYITDCCNELKRQDEVVGLIPSQDLLDKYNSFPTSPNPEKTDIHYCLRCYAKLVINPSHDLMKDKKDKQEFDRLIKLHAFAFKELVIKNYNRRKKVK